jgi:hypothetical protein
VFSTFCRCIVYRAYFCAMLCYVRHERVGQSPQGFTDSYGKRIKVDRPIRITRYYAMGFRFRNRRHLGLSHLRSRSHRHACNPLLANLLRTASPCSLTTLQSTMHCATDPCKDVERMLQGWNSKHSPLRQVNWRLLSADICKDSDTVPRAKVHLSDPLCT